jgi:ferredoxin--NADP+ reductase
MKILDKRVLAEAQGTKIIELKIQSPQIAQKVKPGQFVVLMVRKEGERFPLTVVGKDKDSITLIVQELGLSTKLLSGLKVGDSLYAIVGPLGHSTLIKNYGNVIIIGGGVGIAEIYPVTKALKEAGNCIVTILGSRTKDLLILEQELKSLSAENYITTDDGSYGRKGFVTDVLKELISKDKFDLVYAVGPIPMMKRVSEVTKEFDLETVVSLNSLMVDGTGMCGSCRVTVDKKVKFSCVDGPEFNAHLIDWDEFIKRSRIYEDKEKHICNLNEGPNLQNKVM